MASNGHGNGNNYASRIARRNVRRRHGRGGIGDGDEARGTSRLLLLAIAIGAIGFIALASAGGAVMIVYNNYADDLVAPDELAINQPSYGAKIYDRNGTLLYEYVDDHSGLRRPIKLEGISAAFLAATISTEDDSFFSNPGINVQGLARAAWENSPLSDAGGVFEGSGGSSITQQLVKNVYIAEEERQKRDPKRKIKETVFALELTQKYSKERILEWYVNQISYGGVYNGVEAAAQGYFGKPAGELTLAESALLAGIPQSPSAYDPVNNPEAALVRRNDVLDLMQRQGPIRIGEDTYYQPTEEELAIAREAPIEIATKRFPIEAPHWVLQYIQPQLELLYGHDALFRAGLVVTTTLDLNLNHEVNGVIEHWISQFENISGSRNGAVTIIDPKTGEILAMVGSRDYFREDIQGKNNNVTALNSPGSAFKPFVYLTTFLRLGWTPGTLIVDSPVSIAQNDGSTFTPQNPGRNFQGPISIRNALGNSLNIPPIKAAQQVGVGNIVSQAKKMGFSSLTGSYGPAIATGGVDLTPLDMTFGYSVLAAGGLMNGQEPFVARSAGERTADPIAILKVTDAQGRVLIDLNEGVGSKRVSQRIVQEEYTYLISSILSDGSAQCITFGCGGITIPGRQVAVKTGTSAPFSSTGPNADKIGETWAFGYTPEVVVGIWAGNSDNSPIVNILSTSISFRAMRDSLLEFYDGRPSTPFPRPANVIEETLCVPSGMKATELCGKTTKDLVIKGNEQLKEDTWWQKVKIDARNGLLAGPQTPPQFIEERVMLVPPADLLKTDEDKKKMQELADGLGVPLAPTETSTATGTSTDLPVIIFSPSAGSGVSGNVPVTGRATAPNFDSFKLEAGAGLTPATWVTIAEGKSPIDNGIIGMWNVGGLQPGVYTLRLVVTDKQRGLITSTVVVSVGQGGVAPGGVVTPTPRPGTMPNTNTPPPLAP